jgi:hypothetical protein
MIKKWNEVVKVIANKAIGAIATHDKVCLTTNKYPDTLPTNALKSKLKMMNAF